MTICNHCAKRFGAVIKRRMLDTDIQEIYFECPRCATVFSVAKNNKEIRKLDAKMQKVKDTLLKDKENPELMEDMQTMMRKHKSMMDKLNGKEPDNG